MLHTHEVVAFCKSFQDLNEFLCKAMDTSPTLSPRNLLPMNTDQTLKQDIQEALHPVGIKYEEIILAAMQKHVAGMKVIK